jgi:hypothetical protein
MEPEILSEKIIHQSGCYRRVQRWLRGIHPSRGQIIKGYTGWETYEEKDIIRPMKTFWISEKLS